MIIHSVKVFNKTFHVQKSTRKNKKYDVLDENKNYVLSFGDKKYNHFFDVFGEYQYLNHNDEHRRQNYRKRAAGIGHLDDPYSANFWSYHFLW
jgi:hypothetical protein